MLIVYPWSGVCPSFVVHNFKHEYLCNQWADHNEIISEASLGWGKGCIRFKPDLIKTLVSMATDSSHSIIMEKIVLPLFSAFFHPILFILAGNDDMHGSSEEFEIQPDPTAELAALEPLKTSP